LIACEDPGTGGGGRDPEITDDVFAAASTLSPLPDLPADTTNKFADNDAAAALGQKFFFDKDFSGTTTLAGEMLGDGKVGASGTKCNVACESCHAADSPQMDDRKANNAVAIGTGQHPHNAPGVVNSAYYDWVNWDGRFRRQWELPLPVMESPVIMNGSRLAIGRVIYEKYKAEYETVFGALDTRFDQSAATHFPASGKPSGNPGCAGGAKAPTGGDPASSAPTGGTNPAKPCNTTFDAMPAADQLIVNTVGTNAGKALQAYIRKLVSKNTPFDKYVAAGFKGSDISSDAKKGLALFVGKAGCAGCHSTPFFTDASASMTDSTHAGFKTTGVRHVNMNAKPPTTANLAPNPNTHGAPTGPVDQGQAAALPKETGATTANNHMPAGLNVAGAVSDDKGTGAMLLADVLDVTPQIEMDDPAFVKYNGKFRDPTLRGVVDTAPYMHSGEIAKIEEVVHFYNVGGDADGFAGTKDEKIAPLNLTDDEEKQIVEFLKTLTGGDDFDAELRKNKVPARPTGATYCQ